MKKRNDVSPSCQRRAEPLPALPASLPGAPPAQPAYAFFSIRAARRCWKRPGSLQNDLPPRDALPETPQQWKYPVTRRHAPEPCDETIAKNVPTPAKAGFYIKKTSLFSMLASGCRVSSHACWRRMPAAQAIFYQTVEKKKSAWDKASDLPRKKKQQLVFLDIFLKSHFLPIGRFCLTSSSFDAPAMPAKLCRRPAYEAAPMRVAMQKGFGGKIYQCVDLDRAPLAGAPTLILAPRRPARTRLAKEATHSGS